MDIQKIQQALMRLYEEEQARIVFWNDADGEFRNEVPFLDLDDVQVCYLDRESALAVKYRLEIEDPEGRYLVYEPAEEPDYKTDWLLDIRLYSRSFRADRASIILDALKLRQQRLREHLALRRKFFDNQERLQKLQALVQPDDDEDALDLKMMAVVTRADQPLLFNILRTLYHQWTEEDEDLERPPAGWALIEKYDLDACFWRQVQQRFGFSGENPELRNLLIRLLLSECAQQLGAALPAKFQHLLLPSQGTHNALVFLGQWRDSSSTAKSYDRWSKEIAEELEIQTLLDGFEAASLRQVMTFFVVEQRIISALCRQIRGRPNADELPEIQALIAHRQAGHWAALRGRGDSRIPRAAIHESYTALLAAAEFHALLHCYRAEGRRASDVTQCYQDYTERLYRFDQHYRHFCVAAEAAEKAGWDLLKELREEIEDSYGNGYLQQLALDWQAGLSAANLLAHWSLSVVPNQYDFYRKQVQPQIEKSSSNRVFVIISDALRYEVAQELTERINGEYRREAALDSQLGVLPSHTALGMASLLPGKQLSYTESGEVRVDGLRTNGLDNRNAILERVQGMAIAADTLLGMKRDAGRECIADKRVVYIYHDRIDATGDKAVSEHDAFKAVERTIDDLLNVVRYVQDRLNGNHVLITTDHGFLFTERMPSETDKSRLPDKPPGTVIAKKRYLLGRDLGENPEVWHGHTEVTAKATGDMAFWVPKGTNRFHFTGGARFFHGGLMPQEIVLPIVTVKHKKDKGSRLGTRTRKVGVQVLNDNHRITAMQHRFLLMQTEPVQDRVKPITLVVGIYEGEEAVTNVETITFDSASSDGSTWQKELRLYLSKQDYDKSRDYYLVLRDAETDIEHKRLKVIIDKAIHDEF